jgi:hypothetical protein
MGVIKVKRKLNSGDVIDALSDLFIMRGVPDYIRSDNGPEFVAQAVQDWIRAVGAKTAYIAPGSPWENGYCESLNARFRDELLNGEVFYSLREAEILIEQWRKHYNTKRPHSALGYRPPAPETIIPMVPRPVMHEQSERTTQRGLINFEGAVEKEFSDGLYEEGFIGNLPNEVGDQIGVVVSDAPTDTFKTPAVLGTWLSGLGGNSVKASTEHYVVMQNILSDQKYPGDPDAEYALDDNLIVIGGDYDGHAVQDLLDGTVSDGEGGFITIADENQDGVVDIKDILNPNESSVDYDIAASTDYSVAVKDDGKLLYRWGNMIKKPNDSLLYTTPTPRDNRL